MLFTLPHRRHRQGAEQLDNSAGGLLGDT